jgi:cytoskeletal protein CcmA (bactofilin family)
MARPDRPGMIDGFMSVQAVRHKGERHPDPKSPEAEAPDAKTGESQSGSAQTRKASGIGHTALPSRHELICYACEYGFVVTGSLNKVFCPKCREQLETGDHTIEGEWKQDIRTVGKVHVKPGATVIGATIIATDIVIAGDCTKANLKPTRRIELETGATVPPELLNEHRVRIRAGARLSLTTPLRCKTLDIYGELQATAEPTGLITIHPGGMFRGDLKATHLVVHDGGGMSATVRIAPQKPEPPKVQPKKAETPKTPPRKAGATTKKSGAAKDKPGAKTAKTPSASAKSKPAARRVAQPKGKKRASKRKPRKVE